MQTLELLSPSGGGAAIASVAALVPRDLWPPSSDPAVSHSCLSLSGSVTFSALHCFPSFTSYVSFLALRSVPVSVYQFLCVALSLPNRLFHPLIFLPFPYPSFCLCALPCPRSPPGAPPSEVRSHWSCPTCLLHTHSANADSLPLTLEIAFAFCCQIRIFSAVKMWLMKASAL